MPVGGAINRALTCLLLLVSLLCRRVICKTVLLSRLAIRQGCLPLEHGLSQNVARRTSPCALLVSAVEKVPPRHERMLEERNPSRPCAYTCVYKCTRQSILHDALPGYPI